MRILHVTHELPPYETAGTAIYTLNIARAQARDHEVFVFARLQDPEVRPYRQHTEHRDGLTIRFVNVADLEWSPFRRSYEDPRAERIFRDFVDEVEPEVIHFQHVLGFGKGLMEVPRELGVPSVFTLHDFWAMCPMGQRMCYTDETLCDPIDFGKCGPCVFGDGWQDVRTREEEDNGVDGSPPREACSGQDLRDLYASRVMETPGLFARRPRAALWALGRRAVSLFGSSGKASPPPPANPFSRRFNELREALLRADLLITPSAFLRDQFMQHFDLAPGKIIHSANGMDFSYVRALPKTPSDRLRFGFIGSIIRTKGVHIAVDGFLQAAERQPGIELHIHGAPNRWSGPYLEELKQRAAEHPAGDRVFFHGRFDNSRIGEVLTGVDVLVVPSIWFENAPLTLNEAAMTGTPIIVSDRGGMLEFARANSYGRTFELGNPSSLAEVLEELGRDPSRIRELAGNPPAVKPVGANAAELLGIYRRLLTGTYRPPSLAVQTATRGGVL